MKSSVRHRRWDKSRLTILMKLSGKKVGKRDSLLHSCAHSCAQSCSGAPIQSPSLGAVSKKKEDYFSAVQKIMKNRAGEREQGSIFKICFY